MNNAHWDACIHFYVWVLNLGVHEEAGFGKLGLTLDQRLAHRGPELVTVSLFVAEKGQRLNRHLSTGERGMCCTSVVSRSWEDNAQNCPLIRSLAALSGGKNTLWLVIVRTLAISIFWRWGLSM